MSLRKHYVSGSAERQSGVTGVNWNSNQRKWEVSISVESKLISLGSFVDIDDAIKARKRAEQLKEELMGKTRPKAKGSVYQEFKERIRNQKLLDAQKSKTTGEMHMNDKKRSNYGQIVEMNRDVKMGFILAEDGDKIFFSAEETMGAYNNMKIGDKVVFIKKPGYEYSVANQIRVCAPEKVAPAQTADDLFKKKALAAKSIFGVAPTDKNDPLLWEKDPMLPYGYPWITFDGESYLVKYDEEKGGVISSFVTIPESFKNLDDAQKELKLLCHYLKKDKNRLGYQKEKMDRYVEEAKKRYSLNILE